jgi:phospholipid/cholesterol/gamma-HCH transport system ATP-binding protein
MSEIPNIVEMEGVRLQFGSKVVLDELDLEVKPRERLVVLGQSGTGKSTLLRLILGILRPNAGSVRFRGREINTLSSAKLDVVRTHIGMVYQYSALISSLNVRNNLALPLEELTRKSNGEIERIIDEKLDMVGMLDSKELLPSELSGGMRKRVGLARALVLDPDLILFDEPSAGLDPVISSVIDELIIGLSDQIQTTSIIVTHEMDSAFKIATRMAMLYEGRVIADGAPDTFRNSSNPVVAQFVSGAADGPIQEGHQNSHAD